MNTEGLQGEEKRHQEKVKYPIHTAATNSKHSAKPSLTSTKPHVVDLFISVPVSSFEPKITMHAKDKKKKHNLKKQGNQTQANCTDVGIIRQGILSNYD